MTLGPEFQAIIKDLIIALIQLAALILAGYAAKWVRTNVSQKQMDLALAVSQVVVAAVEQLAASGQIEYKRKMEIAIAKARDQARQWGLNLSDAQWNELLEAAVAAMKVAGEEIKAAPAA